MEFKYSTEIVRKSLDFIDDKELQDVILKRLDELERVFLVNANLSTIILSISSIEGIFIHIASIFKTALLASPNYPLKRNRMKKDFNKLRIEEIYDLLLERDILQRIEHFNQIYTLFRNYRNFIHPQKEKKESWPVGLGQAQMAIGLLNATIDQISKYIFIGSEILERVTGRPRFDLSKTLNLDKFPSARTESFIILKRKIDSKLNLSFNLNLGENAIFNFVFNYVDESNFKMLRLDNRNYPHTSNSLLHCTQRFHWNIVANADNAQPPEGDIKLRIEIDIRKNQFLFNVNGDNYSFTKNDGKVINLFQEFKTGLRVGFFNEIDPVKLSNIKIS
jgi:hypothetical protein